MANLLILGLGSLKPVGFCIKPGEKFFCKARDANPLVTPYQSGIPVDSIAPLTDADNSPAQICRTQAYQRLIGSIGWLAMTTCPNLTVIHYFLSLHNAKPSVGHMKSALYVLHYIHSTYDYGISFTSTDMAPMHSYIHYPPSTGFEAYTDAIPSKLLMTCTLLAYSDACWGL